MYTVNLSWRGHHCWLKWQWYIDLNLIGWFSKFLTKKNSKNPWMRRIRGTLHGSFPPHLSRPHQRLHLLRQPPNHTDTSSRIRGLVGGSSNRLSWIHKLYLRQGRCLVAFKVLSVIFFLFPFVCVLWPRRSIKTSTAHLFNTHLRPFLPLLLNAWVQSLVHPRALQFPWRFTRRFWRFQHLVRFARIAFCFRIPGFLRFILCTYTLQ